MTRQAAKDFYEPQGGETVGYISALDAQNAIDVTYNDFESADSGKVAKTGDTMTGTLVIEQDDGTAAGARLKMDSGGSGIGTVRYAGPTSGFIFDIDGGTGSPSERPVVAGGYPTASTHFATKEYVDEQGIWQAYTPTVGGWTLGNGTSQGRYTRIGQTCHFDLRIVWGTTSVFSGGTLNLGIPLPMNRDGLGSYQYANGVTTFMDGGIRYYGNMLPPDDNSLRPTWSTPATGTLVYPTTTIPFAWEAGDSIEMRGTYETTI